MIYVQFIQDNGAANVLSSVPEYSVVSMPDHMQTDYNKGMILVPDLHLRSLQAQIRQCLRFGPSRRPYLMSYKALKCLPLLILYSTVDCTLLSVFICKLPFSQVTYRNRPTLSINESDPSLHHINQCTQPCIQRTRLSTHVFGKRWFDMILPNGLD